MDTLYRPINKCQLKSGTRSSGMVYRHTPAYFESWIGGNDVLQVQKKKKAGSF
jgi:hypothetical protein